MIYNHIMKWVTHFHRVRMISYRLDIKVHFMFPFWKRKSFEMCSSQLACARSKCLSTFIYINECWPSFVISCFLNVVDCWPCKSLLLNCNRSRSLNNIPCLQKSCPWKMPKVCNNIATFLPVLTLVRSEQY